MDLEPEFECDAAENQCDQHHQDRQVKSRKQGRVSERECAEQPGCTNNEPGFVEVPDRRDRIHGDVALALILHQRKKDSKPKIEAIEQHIHEHCKGDHGSPNDGDVDRHRAGSEGGSEGSGLSSRTESGRFGLLA